MFICENRTTNKKNGDVYIKHVLVESVRIKTNPVNVLSWDSGIWTCHAANGNNSNMLLNTVVRINYIVGS